MKKRGAKIKQGIAVLPFGMKRMKYEMDARAALLAVQRGICNEQHIVDLWVLADLCERLEPGETHILKHCESVKKLCEAIHNKTCDGLAGVSLTASAHILLEWVHKQNNSKVCRIAMEQIQRLAA